MTDKPEQPLPDEWVTVFDDMMRAQQHTERDRDALRDALAEMLESFTEPEDDNDILRRARAALAGPKDG